jgi:soluble lytic murein transglycosylase-like protein
MSLQYEKKGKKNKLLAYGLAASLLAGSLTTAYTNQNTHNNSFSEIENSVPSLNNLESEVLKYNLDPVSEPQWTVEGKLKRAIRFSKLMEEYEQKYGIEKGLLAGLMMQESFAEPTMLNSTGDGGVGLFQIQPGIARHYGLNVYGTSNRTGADFNHGREIKALIEKYNNNLDLLVNYDQRFDPEKSTETAAKLMRELHLRYKDWNSATSAYNQGRPASNPLETKHVRGVRNYQRAYLDYMNEAR